MSVKRLLGNISSERLQESRDFYADLLDMEVVFESDWCIRLCPPGTPELELCIIQRNHPLLPADWRASPVGMYLTFVVDNVDDIHAKAVVRGLPIVQPPRDEFYGQRRFLTRDPDGALVDISSPCRRQPLPEERPPVAIVAPAPVAVNFDRSSRSVRNAARRVSPRRTIDQVLRDARLSALSVIG
ncbi:MAG: VOC family protein [Lautropia sp.]|nr:VOC family protein [Lautropia sp.]